MTFKEFDAWCGERVCDGCWSFQTALFCIEVIKTVNKSYPEQKEKVWSEINDHYKVEETIVKPINEKIEALAKGGE